MFYCHKVQWIRRPAFPPCIFIHCSFPTPLSSFLVSPFWLWRSFCCGNPLPLVVQLPHAFLLTLWSFLLYYIPLSSFYFRLNAIHVLIQPKLPFWRWVLFQNHPSLQKDMLFFSEPAPLMFAFRVFSFRRFLDNHLKLCSSSGWRQTQEKRVCHQGIPGSLLI